MDGTSDLRLSILRARLGEALQKHRLRRGMTPTEMAEFADLAVGYIREMERGEVKATREVLDRLASTVGFNPLDALEGLREPISEATRILLLSQIRQVLDLLIGMATSLQSPHSSLHAQPKAAGPPHFPD